MEIIRSDSLGNETNKEHLMTVTNRVFYRPGGNLFVYEAWKDNVDVFQEYRGNTLAIDYAFDNFGYMKKLYMGIEWKYLKDTSIVFAEFEYGYAVFSGRMFSEEELELVFLLLTNDPKVVQ